MSKQTYTQCELERTGLSGAKSYQAAWITTGLAKVGNALKIREGSKWVDGWVVTGVYKERIEPLDVQRSIRQHRKRTGDSLPKQEHAHNG